MGIDLSPVDAPLHGQWWSPDNADTQVGGRLERDERGIWSLQAFGWIGSWTGRDSPRPQCIHGLVDGTPVTLLDLVPGGWSASDGDPPHDVRTSANTVIVGRFLLDCDRFVGASVRVLNLDEFANRRPWSHETTGGFGDGPVTESITFHQPETPQAEIEGATISIWRGLTTHRHDLASASMMSHEQVHFTFTKPLELDAVLHDYVRPLQNLVELAAAAPSPVLELNLRCEGDGDFASPVSLWSSIELSPPEPEHSFQMLFHADDLGFEQTVCRWWKMHRQFSVVIDLLGSLRSRQGYVSNQFLNGAAAVEAYHRRRVGQAKKSDAHRARLAQIVQAAPAEHRAWLKERLAFSHEPTYVNRVAEAARWCGPRFEDVVGDVEKWAKWVKDGRNGVAHRAPGMVDVDREWRVTVRVTATLEWLLILLLLQDLGLDDTVIAKGVKANRRLAGVRELLAAVKPEWFEASSRRAP